MIECDQWGGGLMENFALDGNDSAAIGIKLTDSANFGTAQNVFRNLVVRRVTDIGIKNATTSNEPNCSDYVFDNVRFYECPVCFENNSDQATNFEFRGGGAQHCGTVWKFTRGGNFAVTGSPSFNLCDLLLDIAYGGQNAGKYYFGDSPRAEMGGYTNQHMQILRATPTSRADIVIVGFQETDFTLDEELVDNEDDPVFEIGDNATVDLWNHTHRAGRKVLTRSGGMFRDTYGVWSTAPETAEHWSGTGTGILVTRATNGTGERLASFARTADEEI
jgi:hypothetical protein